MLRRLSGTNRSEKTHSRGSNHTAQTTCTCGPGKHTSVLRTRAQSTVAGATTGTSSPAVPPPAPQHRHPRALPIHPEIGAIGVDYQGRDLLVLGVLKGAFMLTTDLVRHIYPYPASLEVDFFKASSYGSGTSSSGVVQLDSAFDLDSVRGKHLLLVEDIIDTGNTLSRIVELMKAAGAESVRVCTLLDKKARRKVPMEANYVGFPCPDAFIVGYGIDYAEKYRYLPYIGVPKPEFIKQG